MFVCTGIPLRLMLLITTGRFPGDLVSVHPPDTGTTPSRGPRPCSRGSCRSPPAVPTQNLTTNRIADVPYFLSLIHVWILIISPLLWPGEGSEIMIICQVSTKGDVIHVPHVLEHPDHIGLQRGFSWDIYIFSWYWAEYCWEKDSLLD